MTRSARRALPNPPPEDRDGSEQSVASEDGDVAAQRNADIEARIQRLQDLIKVRNEQLRDIYVLYKNRANAGVLNKPEDFEAAAIDRSTADPARLSPAVGYLDSLGEWHAETPPPTPPEADIADDASLSDAKAISDESVDEDQAMPEDQPADAPAEVVAEPQEPSPVVPDPVKSLVTDYPSSPTPEASERAASNAPSVHDDVDAMDTREEEDDDKFETPEPDAPEETVKVEEQDQVAASSPPLAQSSPRVSVPPVTRSQSAAPTPAAAVLPEAPPATPSVKQASPVPDPTPAHSPTPTPDEAEDASALTPSPSPPPAPVKAATPEEPQAELEPEPDEAVSASPVEEHDAMDVEEAVQPVESPQTDNSTVTPSAIEAPPPVRRTPAYSAAAISALFAPPPPKSPGPLAADDPASPRRRLLQPPPTQTDAMAVDLDFDAAQQPGPPPPPSVLVPESAFTRRLPIPPLSSLPPTFNHTIKPTKLQRLREKAKKEGTTAKTPLPEFIPLGLNRWAATVRANPVYKHVKKSTKILTTNDWRLAFEELMFIRAMDKIDKLKQENMWSFRQPKRSKQPPSIKVHWDYLLDEMAKMDANRLPRGAQVEGRAGA
ncbi:hypothetical protein EXIGLDRAFT_847655 [Exidia glandulosa HHB12029]|uniref:Uncharacterized protein n=1 Tax=Exidia glandulosa HHB12029 TaxID=1314781 RepID=A0A166MR22_EXIGL|nr:hypothetical protein EXIGLDRAFT_847655 [Exidia glandulosa HHB12029]